MGGIVLLPLVLIRAAKAESAKQTDKKKMWVGGICCGLAICAATVLQQIGIMYTKVGNAGFITALYIIFVPILGRLFGKKVHKSVWFCAVLAII